MITEKEKYRTKTAEDLILSIKREGLDYAILHYYGLVECENDSELSDKWNEDYKALTDVENHISDNYPELDEIEF